MPWQIGFPAPVLTADAVHAIGALEVHGAIDDGVKDQLVVAKAAALELLRNVHGPLIRVALSGHANRPRYAVPAGAKEETITVTVSQVHHAVKRVPWPAKATKPTTGTKRVPWPQAVAPAFVTPAPPWRAQMPTTAPLVPIPVRRPAQATPAPGVDGHGRTLWDADDSTG